jgi:hypothetical protein
MKMSDTVVTPGQVERRLRQLSDELDEAHKDLVSAENNYATVKSNYEIAMAKSRIYLSSRSSASGKNYTVQEREDLSLVEKIQNDYRITEFEDLNVIFEKMFVLTLSLHVIYFL